MKFKIIKSDFLEALNITQGVVAKKNVMAILSNVLIEASVQAPLIQLSATDMEVAVHIQAQAQIEKSGRITVNAKSLYDIIKESVSEEISFEVKDETGRIVISSGHSEYNILGLSATEYPALPEIKGDFFRIGTEDLASMIDKVGFAMSTDETRYHLNGVLFEKNEDGLVMVATDGHRLSFVSKDLKGLVFNQDRLILPRKGVNELRSLLSQEKSVELCFSDRHVFCKTEKQTLYIRLLDGNFPDYRRVIPEANPIQIGLPREDLIGALKRVSLLSNERSKGVTFYFCNNLLSVTSSNPEIGEAKEEIDISYSGPILNIGFNAKYFLDVLAVIPDETVNIAFKDNTSPCVVLCESDPGFRSVVMPMRL